ncbi:efflux transporter, RND family, MFP subunit [Hyphomicrobium denitrificans ATCC 51888]|uniref:Efflux transporter, RND family, MFP subunit n=1 Tax=Hyphomicrobium denitrificans (strain ATCC 51888 / DSM 1869 / NCIMB 11706 / TK 0415) TaxID=582899 RepID=D8JYU5_HYPDA|nr:efflux RND transporter periplasmic adaptor subunit [Hyphomicrobium denitrificans]ADJ23547.1 efflux transporter, RND family, MFP subunit [Hyphomicrobium denitrificans ATCC 51888]
MSVTKGLVSAAAIIAAAGAGLWACQTGLIKLPLSPAAAMTETHAAASGPVVYYRDPNGKPFYSLAPRNTDDGKAYVAVQASEDVSFEPRPKTEAVARAASSPGDKRIKFYRNPMGLPDTSPVPKKDSMGMDYIPVYEGDDSDDGSIRVSPGKIQRTGVETVEVGRHPIIRTIQAPGAVAIDERRVAVVAPKFDGYVVKVGDITTGTHVRKGDVLATVFGQAILDQAARLLIEQNSGFTRSDDTFTPPSLKGPGGVVGASRRLQNLGVTQEFIDQVKRDRQVPDIFTIRAPISGDVLERNWSDGQGFKQGDVGFRIADHSVVWMMADAAEGDIALIKPGQRVKVTMRAYPGRVFEGKVGVVYPHLIKETRTAQVRIEMANADMALLPDMYGNVEIATGGNADALAVPASAVIDSGNRQVALLDLGNGRYQPREVKLGRTGDGFREVLSGLSEGDKVVVNGNFLIDAESNLQSALKGFDASATTPSSTEASQ